MQPNARLMLSMLALLILGAVISAPSFAVGVAGTPHLKMGQNKTKADVITPVKPRILELKPMPTARLARLKKEAHAKYDQAMKYVDHINYERAVECFQQAIQLQPDDAYLRFMLIQLTQYLGDVRTGDPREASNSLKYYDITIEQLQSMVASPMLNPREKQRAQSALETVVGLRQAIGEREGKRHQAGLEMAKQYSQEMFKDMEKDERAAAKKKDAVQDYVKTINTTPAPKSAQTRPGAVYPAAGMMRPGVATMGIARPAAVR